MKSLITLMVGLMAAGAAAAYSDFSLATPTAIQLFSIAEPNEFQMILVGVALVGIGSLREYLGFIDRKGLDAEKSAD